MALSFYANTNWRAAEQYLNAEMNSFPQTQSELPTEFFTFQESFGFSNGLADQFLCDPDQYLCSDDYTHHLLPYFSYPSDHLVSLSPDIFPPQELESYHYPKRQKAYEDEYYLDFAFSQGPELVPQLQVPPPAYSYCGCATVESSGMRKDGRESLSAQSIAARQRRRKITEKTQELGKLIPGGNKMNTAEMFQAAFKYVKFLQAQVALLQLVDSVQMECKDEGLYVEELQAVGSAVVQEKLYSDDKCLVPKKFVEKLGNDQQLLQSNPVIFNAIHHFIQTND